MLAQKIVRYECGFVHDEPKFIGSRRAPPHYWRQPKLGRLIPISFNWNPISEGKIT